MPGKATSLNISAKPRTVADVLSAELIRSTSSACVLLDFAAERGLTDESVLTGTGLRRSQLQDAAEEIQPERELRLIENLVGLLGDDPEVGLDAGCRYELRMFGMYGLAIMSAHNLRQQIEISLRYQDVAFTLARASMPSDGVTAYVALEVSHLPRQIRSFVVDHCFATVWQSWRYLERNPPTPRIELTRRRPCDTTAYRRLFGVEPQLGADQDRLGVSQSALERPRTPTDPQALELCETRCREILAQRRARLGTSGLVRFHLSNSSGPVPSMDAVAHDLHMSTRSLRRALDAEGTTFREIDEDVRKNKARALIAAGQSISQTAHLTGYASASSFLHAFRRWFGVPPGAFRDALAHDGASAGDRLAR